MKKVTLLGVIILMLAVSVVPVMAANGGSNGHGNGQGNGSGVGQGNSSGDHNQNMSQDRTRDQDQTRLHTSSGNANRGAHGTLSSLRMRTPFYLQGKITAVGANSLTVEVIHASAKAKLFIGTTLTVQVPTTTIIYELTQGEDENGSSTTNTEGEGNKVIIPLAQLEVGKIVAIHGNLIDSVYTARLITEYIGNFLGAVGGTP
ncbi:MAG: hypothetical protein ACM3H7_08545 [Acidobacteriaceae bacterium]